MADPPTDLERMEQAVQDASANNNELEALVSLLKDQTLARPLVLNGRHVANPTEAALVKVAMEKNLQSINTNIGGMQSKVNALRQEFQKKEKDSENLRKQSAKIDKLSAKLSELRSGTLGSGFAFHRSKEISRRLRWISSNFARVSEGASPVLGKGVTADESSLKQFGNTAEQSITRRPEYLDLIEEKVFGLLDIQDEKRSAESKEEEQEDAMKVEKSKDDA